MTARQKVQAPIILVGSPRSGTTLLGQLFAAHPEVAYWEEPRPIWSIGNAYRQDDVLTAEDLTPGIARAIDQRFHRFLSQSGRSRFAEKTPSNMLRLRFIHALYPDCRIIHIYRDGRSVVSSSLRMLEKPPDRGRILARLQETPLRSWPAMGSMFLRDVLLPKLRGGRKSYWGPKPPGWEAWTELSPAAMMARQWAALMKIGRADVRSLPEDAWMELRYEDLLAQPESHLLSMLEFAGLPAATEVSELAAKNLNADRVDAWKTEADPEVIAQVEAEAGAMLQELGYR